MGSFFSYREWCVSVMVWHQTSEDCLWLCGPTGAYDFVSVLHLFPGLLQRAVLAVVGFPGPG